MTNIEKKPDLKELAKILSDAYYHVLQHANSPREALVKDLTQLSNYSNDLPVPWFTHAFMDTLLSLKDEFITHNNITGLQSILTLFSSWLRRCPTTDNNHLTSVLDTLFKVLTSSDPTYLTLQKECWIGWVGLIGKEQDIKLLDGMTSIILAMEDPARIHSLADTVDAGVAHALAQTTALNDFEVETCQHLLEAHIQFCHRRRLDGPRAMMTTMEHVVDIRSQETPQSCAEAHLTTLVQMAKDVVSNQSDAHFVRLAVVAGIVRMLQFNQGKNTKKVLALRESVEAILIQHLDMAVKEEHTTVNQDWIAFFAGRCLIQIPPTILSEMKNTPALLKVMSQSLLSTLNGGDILHRLQNTGAMTAEVSHMVEQPMFKDIGRISRAIAKLVEICIQEKKSTVVVQAVLDRLVGVSYNVFFDWDRYLMAHSSKTMTAEESSNYKDLENKVWTLFKSMMFSFTVILKSVAVDTEGLVGVPHAAQDIIATYANLNFMTENLGEGVGRQAYQETLTNAVAYLLHDSCQLNTLLSTAFKEFAPSHFVKDTTPAVELLSFVKQSRLLFFSDLVEQVMSRIENEVLEQDILPVLYPILKWKRIANKNLYESAHTAVISAFLAEKPVSRELAGVYSQILIENFPEPMNLDQFRFGFSTLIGALCSMDDALAWLTVEGLIHKIRSLTNEKDLVLRNEYTTALIDLLKPLSLGPFFPSIQDEIKRLILAQETEAMQKATMKILFETVSGSGISDMRRTEAVGWFLELKHELKF